MSIKDRGFASMDKDAQRALARQGGTAAHAKGTAYTWTPAQAREAGIKGGAARRRVKAERLAATASSGLPATATAGHDPDLDRFADEGNPHS